MNDEAKRRGAAVKGYVGAKWRGPARSEEVEHLGRTLDPALRARVDAIGMDDQELLHVAEDAIGRARASRRARADTRAERRSSHRTKEGR